MGVRRGGEIDQQNVIIQKGYLRTFSRCNLKVPISIVVLPPRERIFESFVLLIQVIIK